MSVNKRIQALNRARSLSPSRGSSLDSDSDDEVVEPPQRSIKSSFGGRRGKAKGIHRPGRSGRSEFHNRQMRDTPILEDDDEEGSYEVIPMLPTFRQKGVPKHEYESERQLDEGSSRGQNFTEDETRRRLESELDSEVDHTFSSLNAGMDLFRGEEVPRVANDEAFSSSDSEASDAVEDNLDQRTNKEISETSSSGHRRSSHGSDITAKKSLRDVIRDRLSMNRVSTDDSTSHARRRAETLQTMDSGKSERFLNRLMNFGNITSGGLTPGASKADQTKETDEEARIYDVDIPLDDMNLEQLNDEANGIVRQHGFNSSATLTPSGIADSSPSANGAQHGNTTMEEGSSLQMEGNHFYAPNPDYYMRGYDLNYDNAPNDDDYVPPPEKVSAGVLSSLLTLYKNPGFGKSFSRLSDSGVFTPRSGSQTPTESVNAGYDHQSLLDKLKRINSTNSLPRPSLERSHSETDVNQRGRGHRRGFSSHTLGDMSSTIGDYTHSLFPGKKLTEAKINEGKVEAEKLNMPRFATTRPKDKGKTMKSRLVKKRLEAQARITVHIADVLQRQRFILKLCKTLMLYGAPTHRLEEYMTMTARVLEIDGQFIYFPGCMIVSFGDAATRTSEMQLVRCVQGLDLGKLDDAHQIYKDVVHDVIGVEEAAEKIEALLRKPPLYNAYICVFIYGFSSAMVTTWGFKGGWIDMPVSFGIGCLVGVLQYIVAPRSNLYSSVFEVSASIVVSFLGRALGSVDDKETICFSAVVQGSLALILPGYIILCGSLELQSRNLVAGAVRMFYAIIYSLFLGFGITLGAALYGWIDHGATSETVCSTAHQISPWYRFLLVPMFAIGLALVNQARWQQLPPMVIIAGGAYVVSYFSGLHFSNATEFTSAIGAFMCGLLANLYSRIRKGVAVTAMLPAIFVIVPSGIASQGSLLSGINTANEIVNSTTGSTTTSTSSSSTLSFGVVMIQVSIGISVGLFAATIAIYPLGKKRTGLFTL
ncbi:unnamed protein product [Kuraishia capsulata CBS 1993]|uniref:Pheromone-regulated membrane protein 10 n=1 Tax=Kuraishia capsulata CBS 1993 TaxID=1382522 RepID=W6MN08_9ASCO|nr:uncharacterized protein KUCA_T00003592001 [Kuraishia capsulata CBS 1993]CDK27613.1 unnamed protein product [Kuraishia capsulata CBS 1993]